MKNDLQLQHMSAILHGKAFSKRRYSRHAVLWPLSEATIYSSFVLNGLKAGGGQTKVDGERVS